MKATTEAAFEKAIVDHLVPHGGYELRPASAYVKETALLPDEFVGYLAETQSAAWKRLNERLPGQARQRLLQAVHHARATEGILHLLHRGFEVDSVHFEPVQFAPASTAAPSLVAAYEANRLHVVRQVHHDPKKPHDSVDVVLFLNGLPIVTVELKARSAKQSATEHGLQQYRDRDPEAPLFRFLYGAVVHFAVDEVEAWMTTRLARNQTRFFPFNRGNGTGKGNRVEPGKGDRTFYLWEDIWTRPTLLELLQRFVYVEVKQAKKKNAPPKKTIIFPRYHQLDAVRELVSHATDDGPGNEYLVQHSAGSGKSNTIAWLAHHLSTLHDADDERVFDRVVVITDRRVLDDQMQSIVQGAGHDPSWVTAIDGKSADLGEALAVRPGQTADAGIVVTTLQKFAHLQTFIDAVPDLKYAVIADEAHSSQGGELVRELKAVLGVGAEVAEGEASVDAEGLMALALARGRQPNLSFFAFTATPREETLELFGRPEGKDPETGKQRFSPHHLYAMRQAIEEGFILDVLQGYVSYKRYYALTKKVEGDPDVDQKKAVQLIRDRVDASEKNVRAKVDIIARHFRREAALALPGDQARGMVVTRSREQAMRFYLGFLDWAQKHGAVGLRPAVAFSGHLMRDGQKVTEASLNHFAESALPGHFEKGKVNLLVVADKYQTGFDEPRLVAMYIDKPLANVQAVQTLSRLNRTFPDKDRTFVLDFVNEPEKILEAFQRFYEKAELVSDTDPAELASLKATLDGFGIHTQAHIDDFTAALFSSAIEEANGAADAFKVPLQACVKVFEERDEDQREQYRGALKRYLSRYVFLAQLVDEVSLSLEQFYQFGQQLIRYLPVPQTEAAELPPDPINVKWLKVRQRKLQPKMNLVGGGGEAMKTKSGGGGGKKPPASPQAPLSAVIELVNERWGGAAAVWLAEFVQDSHDDFVASPAHRQAVADNDRGQYANVVQKGLRERAVDRFAAHPQMSRRLIADRETLRLVAQRLADALYDSFEPDAVA